MDQQPLNLVYLTPGAGGMFCGSCLNDNMLAANLHRMGHDVTLVPLYTPITTDEPNASIDKLFFGGINVYLQQKVPLFRFVPRFLDRALDSPGLVGKLAGRAVGLEAKQLGQLTLSMVRGEHGHQRKEVRRLVDWLKTQSRPDVVNFSNLLIAGCAPSIKRELGVPIVVTLQGDDVFLDDLPDPYRQQVIAEMQSLAACIDRFVVHSDFYAEKMRQYFDIPGDRIDVVPLGISLDGFSPAAVGPPPTIGYLARICPAKGLHLLVDAFLKLKRDESLRAVELHVAGWLGEADRAYFEQQRAVIHDAGLADDFHYAGVLNREEKADFLRSLTVFSVPTTYHEPKGRYVLEALACGVPVVQPGHGAFPELLGRTGGGRLYSPLEEGALPTALAEVLTDTELRNELSQQGLVGVATQASASQASEAMLAVYQRCRRPSA